MKKPMLIFAIIVVFGVFASSCQSKTDNAGANDNIDARPFDDADNSDSGGNSTPEKTESRSSIADNLPEKDYQGYEFRFFTNEDTDYGDLAEKYAPESEIGEVVNDAVFRRNRTVEERFNINIKTVSSGNNQSKHSEQVRKNILSGDDAFDVALVHCIWGPNLRICE